MGNKEELIRAEELYRSFTVNDTKIEVLNGINLSINNNELTAIMGRSGSGKTTLLKLLGLLDRPTTGRIMYKGENSRSITGDKLAAIHRNNIGFVYQDYYLMDSLSVLENIMLPKILNHEETNDCIKSAMDISGKLEISSLLDKRPFELSGGEKQRVAICRALINNPELILADEPTGNLDSASAETVMRYFEMIHTSLNTAVVLVTHDPSVASCCKRVVFLKDGTITSDICCSDNNRESFLDRIIENQKIVLKG